MPAAVGVSDVCELTEVELMRFSCTRHARGVKEMRRSRLDRDIPSAGMLEWLQSSNHSSTAK